jgi:hypothetical protein
MWRVLSFRSKLAGLEWGGEAACDWLRSVSPPPSQSVPQMCSSLYSNSKISYWYSLNRMPPPYLNPCLRSLTANDNIQSSRILSHSSSGFSQTVICHSPYSPHPQDPWFPWQVFEDDRQRRVNFLPFYPFHLQLSTERWFAILISIRLLTLHYTYPFSKPYHSWDNPIWLSLYHVPLISQKA